MKTLTVAGSAMRRLIFLLTAALAGLSVPPFAVAQPGDADTRRPNIIFLLTDDQGWGDAAGFPGLTPTRTAF